jgi:uncharacterized protein YfaS (alpha-2-macroglobulin family)
LRIMAIAYSKSGVGKAEAPLTIRDPVVPDVALPRFLAPGDEGRMTVLVDNRDGEAGDYRFEVQIEGAASLPDSKPWSASPMPRMRTGAPMMTRPPMPFGCSPPLIGAISADCAKSIFEIDGTPLDPASLPQNHRFIVSLDGSAADHALHRLALVDLLPAGWEIEAVFRPDQAPAFLGDLTRPRVSETRDDRLVAALDLGEEGYHDFYRFDMDDDDDKKRRINRR